MCKKTLAESYISELCSDRKFSYDDLKQDELRKLTGLIILSMNEFDRSGFMTECQNPVKIVENVANYLMSFNEFPYNKYNVTEENYCDKFMEHMKRCKEDLLESIIDESIKTVKNEIDRLFQQEDHERSLFPDNWSLYDCAEDNLQFGEI